MRPCTYTEPKSCELEIDVDGFQGYNLTFTTGDDRKDETTVPVHIQLIGEKGFGQEKVISETGFKTGISKPLLYQTTPIGKIVGFKLGLESKGRWQPTKITIQDLGN